MTKKKQTTSIEWVLNSDVTAGYAINLWIGCSKISPACDNCYAEISRVSTCLGVKWGDNEPRHKCNPYKKLTAIHNKSKRQFHAWELAKEQFNAADAELIAKGFIKPPRIRVFINPDSDIFDNKAPQEWRDEFFNFVGSTPSIDYILVTKRIGNAKKMIPQSWLDNGYPTNVWQLITVCNQAEAQRDISKLLMLKIKVRGLSVEPLLSEINLLDTDAIAYNYSEDPNSSMTIGLIDWLILGGESSKNARPMNPNWSRKIRDQCVDAGVPFFHKQNGEWGIVDCWDGYANQHNHKTLTDLGFKIPENGILQTYTVDSTAKITEKERLESWCYDVNDFSKNPILLKKVGKKAAGNLLDGQVWQQIPEVKL